MDIREKLEILRHKLAGMLSAAVEPCDEGECCESCKYFHSTACSDYLIADYMIANGVTVQEWIPVSERLPEPEQEVLVQCETRPSSFKYQCKAFYVPPKWLRDESAFNWDYECCNEYDEDADDYYVNEGWYERVHNWDDYNAVGIGDFVTHWMPLPTPPKGE